MVRLSLLATCLFPAFAFAVEVPVAPTTLPAPAWMHKSPHDWPQILMVNEIVDRTGASGLSGSSSLARLPNGVVVLFTAGHLLKKEEFANYSASIKSWKAESRANLRVGVPMTLLAMDTSAPPALDAIVLCPDSQRTTWPTQTPPVRQTPLQVGDPVYLVAVPNGENSVQEVFPGSVVSIYNNHEVQFNVDGSFNTLGCSGSPVIDSAGQLAGVYTAHLNDQNIPGKMQLVCVDASAVLPLVKLPPAIKPAAQAQSGAATRPAAPADSPGDSDLRIAKLLIDNKQYDKARARLQSVIAKYPDTDAAKKAAQMLAQIPEAAQ